MTQERSSLLWRDLLSEVVLSLGAKPSRTFLTAIGTILGVASLISTLGLAQTAGSQIVARFDELEATEIVLQPTELTGEDLERNENFPWDAESRIQRLNGVAGVGTYSDLSSTSGALVRAVPFVDPTNRSGFRVPLVSVSPGIFEAAKAELSTGRFFDSGHDRRGDGVAVLGPAAAKRLNVTRVDNSPAIFVGDRAVTVIGILSETARKPQMLNAVIVPDGYARRHFDLVQPATVLIDVEIGAVELIATQAPVALAPNDPSSVEVLAASTPQRVESNVRSDINALFFMLGLLSLVVGAIGIANTTLVSVLERSFEIGLRRAIGARPKHIVLQFLAESTSLGIGAGFLGAALSMLIIVAVAFTREWTPVLSLWVLLSAPIIGAIVGLLAGIYPAIKAAKIEPIVSLRSAG